MMSAHYILYNDLRFLFQKNIIYHTTHKFIEHYYWNTLQLT